MSEKIKITCPKCKTKWEKSLAELEKKETLYRGEEKKIVEYRDSCPVCGTYAIIESSGGLTMPKVLSIREETSEEKKLREWFETQALESPKNLEDAARLLIGLVTGLLGALFGVLTVSAETLPAYLSLSAVKWCGVLAVALWLLSLLSALVVVTPRKWQSDAGKPETQSQVFKAMLSHKSRWLRDAVMLFSGGVIALGIVLVIALGSI